MKIANISYARILTVMTAEAKTVNEYMFFQDLGKGNFDWLKYNFMPWSEVFSYWNLAEFSFLMQNSRPEIQIYYVI